MRFTKPKRKPQPKLERNKTTFFQKTTNIKTEINVRKNFCILWNNLEDFQFLDDAPIDKSIDKRDYLKNYHQQRAQLNNSCQSTDFAFGGENNFHPVGNGYLESDKTVRKKGSGFNGNVGDGNVNKPIRTVIKAYLVFSV